MKRTLLVLLLGIVAGVGAHVGWLAGHQPTPGEGLPAQLAWMKTNLHLTGAQLARLQVLHEESAPRLLALAAEVTSMREELAAFERERKTVGRIDFLEFARYVDQRRALDRACIDSTRNLITASADVMTPPQREHYLSLLGPALQSDRTNALPLKNAAPAPLLNAAPVTDLAELQALQRGDDSALNRLIARWEGRLFGFAWRYVRNSADAQDLVAEVFVRLYQTRERLRPGTNLSAWLFTTLTNLCHNHHRWRRRHPALSLDDADSGREESLALAVDEPLPAQILENQERLAALAEAIDRLPPDLKVTLLLHHYERLSYREIGEIVGCSEGGVDTRLYRARARLRAALGAGSTLE